jgi:hypothetical protein
MIEGAERRASMCQDFYQTFYLRERYIVSVSSNFLTQFSHGTKCRKTRAKQRDFTIVDSLVLRAVRVKPISCALRACFLGHYRMARMSQSASSCGLASSIYIAAIYYYDALLRFHYKIQTSSYSRRIFAQIKRAKNIDSFEKK